MLHRVFPAVTASKVQTTTYLIGVALFSISFLVFLNASISFVITDCIGRKEGVGDAVGTLGFADELLALVACPLWGLLSDRIGVRNVTAMGYGIIAVSFVLLVQSKDVYPQLLLGRLLFSLGGAACTTMVTAILPTLTMHRAISNSAPDTPSSEQPAPRPNSGPAIPDDISNARHSGAFSVSSELTITPARYRVQPQGSAQDARKLSTTHKELSPDPAAGVSSQLAGYVGMFTGVGALLAVALFLPLPATFAGHDISKENAVKDSFYIVAAIALTISILVSFGLRGLPGDEGKGFKNLWFHAASGQHKRDDSRSLTPAAASYLQLAATALKLAFTDSRIGLGYLGGFVARASSVAISLFVPLFVNAYFIRQGLCTDGPGEEIKSHCKRAYTLASMLTGFAELAALILAPLFGFINGRLSNRGSLSNLPLGVGAIFGIAGSIWFGLVDDPDAFKHGSIGVLFAVVLLGISQIAAIVCSLGSLSRGIQDSTATSTTLTDTERTAGADAQTPDDHEHNEAEETAPLISAENPGAYSASPSQDRTQLKGTIAGIYSLVGGVGILLLTKLGGVLFDTTSVGAPFFLLAGFNGLLLVAVIVVTIGQRVRGSK